MFELEPLLDFPARWGPFQDVAVLSESHPVLR